MFRSVLLSRIVSVQERLWHCQTRNIRGKKSVYEGLDRLMNSLGVRDDELIKEDPSNLHFDEEDYDAQLSLSGQLEEQSKEEFKAQKIKAKRSIIKKKYFKEERPTNLLTWAAKAQIRFLHQQNPVEWIPERLAESFPIDIEGVKSLLRNNFMLKNEEDIQKHDARVEKNWKLLKSGGNSGNISSATKFLWLQNKFSKQNYNGNVLYPMPAKTLPPKSVIIGGEFSNLVINQENRHFNDEIKDKDNNYSYDDGDDMVSATVYKRRDFLSPKEYKHVTAKMFEENIQKQSPKSVLDYEYISWIQKTRNSKENQQTVVRSAKSELKQEHQIIKKYANKEEFIELKIDTKKDDENVEDIYLYDETHGYQKPLGVGNDLQDIQITKNFKKKGEIYQFKNSFYDQNGTFLYKIPG